MNSLVRLTFNAIIVITMIGLIFYLYQTYGPRVIEYVFGEQKVSVLVGNTPVTAAVADTDTLRQRGLSDVTSMPANEGMLFIFDREGDYQFWMQGMSLPLDIMWINDRFEIVHIERNVRPESYPARYGSPIPARFVLEVNAFFANTFNINVGDRVSLPAHAIPLDLR